MCGVEHPKNKFKRLIWRLGGERRWGHIEAMIKRTISAWRVIRSFKERKKPLRRKKTLLDKPWESPRVKLRREGKKS